MHTQAPYEGPGLIVPIEAQLLTYVVSCQSIVTRAGLAVTITPRTISALVFCPSEAVKPPALQPIHGAIALRTSYRLSINARLNPTEQAPGSSSHVIRVADVRGLVKVALATYKAGITKLDRHALPR